MGKKRFGKYVSRLTSRSSTRKKHGGSARVAGSANVGGSAQVGGSANVGGSARVAGSVVASSFEGDVSHDKTNGVMPVAFTPHIFDNHVTADEDLFKEIDIDPLMPFHNSLAINHGLREHFSYDSPHEIDLEAMASAIRDKHMRVDHHGNRKHVAGGLWEDIQRGVGDGLTIGGSLGQIIGGATGALGTALIATPVGAPMVAAGAGMFALGTGAKLSGELAGSEIKTPGVSIDKFILGK